MSFPQCLFFTTLNVGGGPLLRLTPPCRDRWGVGGRCQRPAKAF